MKDEKIFCISFQRTGTKSVGEFLNKHGFKTATWKTNRRNCWTEAWLLGDYEKIFSTDDFISHNAFEDDPWWCLDFYKYLYHRFPNSKFICLHRDPNSWFDSMIRHSAGTTLGNTYLHCKLYNRIGEFHELPIDQGLKDDSIYSSKLDRLMFIHESHRNLYTQIYNTRHREIIDFFTANDRNRLSFLRLEDKEKWVKLGQFLKVNVDSDFDSHLHDHKKTRAYLNKQNQG